MPVCSIVGYFGWWWDGSRSFFFWGAFTHYVDKKGEGLDDPKVARFRVRYG